MDSSRAASDVVPNLVDDENELVSVIDQLMANTVVFVRIANANGDCAGTTLMPAAGIPILGEGQHATVLSWSGVDRLVD